MFDYGCRVKKVTGGCPGNPDGGDCVMVPNGGTTSCAHCGRRG